MNIKGDYEIEEIKKQLINSCINFNSRSFLPYLLSPSVIVSFPNKVRFYNYFSDILNGAKEISQGNLELRVEKESWEEDKDLVAYNFYDQVHQYPRINLQVKETTNNLFLDISPF